MNEFLKALAMVIILYGIVGTIYWAGYKHGKEHKDFKYFKPSDSLNGTCEVCAENMGEWDRKTETFLCDMCKG